MPTRTRFTEGLSRLKGAPLEAPYDLTNAHLRDVSGVEAVLVPRQPASDTPSAPARYQTPVRHSNKWIDARGVARRAQVLYVTTPPGSGDGLTTYRGLDPSKDTRIPQITQIDTALGGQDAVRDPFDDDLWPRYIYYMLVPINDNGEAGPLAFAGARINDDTPLPSLSITGNDSLRWIGVYRTPAIYERQNEVSPGAQAFYEAARVGVGGGGVSSDATRELGIDIPEGDEAIRSNVSNFNYYNKTGIDHIYLAATTRIEAEARITADDLNVDPVGWKVRFYDIPDLASSSLSENTAYEIYGTGTNANGDFYFEIENTDGTALSFDAKPLIESEPAGDLNNFWRLVRGATVELIPPDSASPGAVSATAVYSDDKNWYMDVGPDQQEDFTPTGDPFDRPFNVYAPSGVSVTADSGTPNFSQSTPIQRPRARDLHYNGGLLYAAAPKWPTKIPSPMYLETDGTDGFDVRLQYEYSLPNDEVLGPPLEITDVTRLAVGWQGAEQAVNVYVNTGTPGYKIVSANIGNQLLTMNGAPTWFQNQISAGDEVEVREGGRTVEVEVKSHSVSTGDVTLDLPVNGFSTDAQVVGRDTTTLTQNTDDIAARDQIEINDSSGDLASLTGGQIAVLDFDVEPPGGGDNGVGTPSPTPRPKSGTDPGRPIQFYTIKSSTHDANNGTTTLTVYNTVLEHPAGSQAILSKPEDVDDVGTSGTNPTQVVVVDRQNDLGSLTSGTTIDIDGGPNDGSHTLSSGSQANTPSEGRTTLPLQSLSEESDKGQVLHGSGPTNWELYRRVTVGPYGMFTRSGSTFVFSAQAYAEGATHGRSDNLEAYADSIEEVDAVFFSNIERPLEVTFDQFTVPEGQTIRALFRARLAEEEGLRSYRFYVGTESAIYAARPIPQDREAELYAVTTAFGIGTSPQEQPVHAFVPGGVIVKATSGHLYALSGRRAERVFQGGQPPWSTVRDIAYDQHEEVLFVATGSGIWGYDRQRKGIVSHHDIDADLVLWDEKREATIAYDESASAWKTLHWNGWQVVSIDTGNNTVTVRGDRTNDFSATDLIEVGDLGVFEVSSVSTSGGNTDLSLAGSITSTDAQYARKYESGAVETQPITPGGNEVALGEVKADYDRLDYDPAKSGTYATLAQTRRHSNDSRTVDFPRGYGVYPPLRGEGLQIEISGIQVLTGLEIESIEPAD